MSLKKLDIDATACLASKAPASLPSTRRLNQRMYKIADVDLRSTSSILLSPTGLIKKNYRHATKNNLFKCFKW